MFRNLIPALADRYHLVAPDLPGFGFSNAPERTRFSYTFENLAKVIGSFVQAVGLERFTMYVFDHGAPVGFRLALPERIAAIISQNGNAYEEGLSEGWNRIQRYSKDPTGQNRTTLRDFLTPQATKFQYLYGVKDETLVAPEAYQLDSAFLARSGNDEIQLDLFWITRATLPCIRSSRTISAQKRRLCSRCGARTTRSFCHKGLKHTA